MEQSEHVGQVVASAGVRTDGGDSDVQVLGELVVDALETAAGLIRVQSELAKGYPSTQPNGGDNALHAVFRVRRVTAAAAAREPRQRVRPL